MNPFLEMQKAVDIVNTSPHPTNKIAATVFGRDQGKASYSISYTNYWPDIISSRLGSHVRIGNSSGTIHAETACLLNAPQSKGSSLCITDPFCPNCAKNMAEAGVKTIFIDHKGFNKDFAVRRHQHFQSLSMQVCEKAGICVYELWRKEERLVPILEIPKDYEPREVNPVLVEQVAFANEKTLKATLARYQKLVAHRDTFALALAEGTQGDAYSMFATAQPAIGYSEEENAEIVETGKYSLMLEPVNRLLMTAPKHGLKIKSRLIFCRTVPTAREQVNLVGAGLRHIHIGETTQARDRHALQAFDLLTKAGVLTSLEP